MASPRVMDLRLKQDVGGDLPVRLLLPDHGEPGGLRSGIELDPDGLRFPSDPLFQPDGERDESVDHRLPVFEKLPGPGRMAGHQGLLFPIEDKHLHSILLEPLR